MIRGMTPKAEESNGATLEERITGALVGAAVGDALGGPVEGYTPEQILERHGGRVHGIVGPWHGDDWRTARPIAPYHKGDGHVTDDTLMTHALIRVYDTVRDHLDAYAIADHLVPDLMTTPRWIPELEAEALPLQRIFLAEKWLVTRLHYGHVDPREAGVGNIVNCGAAMYMAPVGLVNAADPAGRLRRGAGHRGRPPVVLRPGGGGRLRGGGRGGVRAGRDPGLGGDDLPGRWPRTARAPRSRRSAKRPPGTRDFESALVPLREAVRPYDTVGPDYRGPRSAPAAPPGCTRSRNSPIALGMLLVAGGDYRRAVLGSVNYGRDCDSIATMAGAVAGALGSPVPDDWSKQVAEASRLDLWHPAATLAEVAREVFDRDVDRRRAHERGVRRTRRPATHGCSD